MAARTQCYDPENGMGEGNISPADKQFGLLDRKNGQEKTKYLKNESA